MTVSFAPMLTELTLAPGSSGQFTVMLRNDSADKTVECSIYAADIQQRPDGQYRLAEAGGSAYSAVPFIQLSADRAEVGPGEVHTVVATVTVPWGVSGGRYAAVVFELEPEARADQSGAASTAVVQRLMSVVEVTIPGRQTQSRLDIVGFSALGAEQRPSFARQYGPDTMALEASVRNSGEVHVFARGTFVLRDASGRRLLETPIGGGRGIVLPGATVSLATILPRGLAPGGYVADISVSYGGARRATARVPFTVDSVGDVVVGGTGETAGGGQMAAIASLSVSPAELELSYMAGATITRTLTVENLSDQSIQVEVRVAALAVDGQAASAPSCEGWIQLWPERFAVAPGARQTVQMILSIPEGEWGGRYASILLDAQPMGDGQSWSVQTGSQVYLCVGRDVPLEAELGRVEFEDSGPTAGTVAGVVLANTGAAHFRPRTTVQLMAESEGTGSWVMVGSMELSDEAEPLLPGATRALLAPLPSGLEPGRYQVRFLVECEAGRVLTAEGELTVESANGGESNG